MGNVIKLFNEDYHGLKTVISKIPNSGIKAVSLEKENDLPIIAFHFSILDGTSNAENFLAYFMNYFPHFDFFANVNEAVTLNPYRGFSNDRKHLIAYIPTRKVDTILPFFQRHEQNIHALFDDQHKDIHHTLIRFYGEISFDAAKHISLLSNKLDEVFDQLYDNSIKDFDM